MTDGLSLIFESHATSRDNEAGLASGWFDVDLSPTGEEQARMLGARRRDDVLAAVFCSDLARSFRTGDIAFGDRSLTIVREARLRECDYGELTRSPISEIEQLRVRHVSTPFPGGESCQQVADRVSEWLNEITKQFDGCTVLVIGHRATFLTSNWRWQPGWTYQVTHRQSPAASFPGSASRVS